MSHTIIHLYTPLRAFLYVNTNNVCEAYGYTLFLSIRLSIHLRIFLGISIRNIRVAMHSYKHTRTPLPTPRIMIENNSHLYLSRLEYENHLDLGVQYTLTLIFTIP